MNDFQIMAKLIEVFGDRLRVTRRYFQFAIGPGTTIYVRRRFPMGFENAARIRETAAENFPNGRQLDTYLVAEDVPREWRTRWYEYAIGPEHIEDVIEIVLGGINLSDDWIDEAA